MDRVITRRNRLALKNLRTSAHDSSKFSKAHDSSSLWRTRCQNAHFGFNPSSHIRGLGRVSLQRASSLSPSAISSTCTNCHPNIRTHSNSITELFGNGILFTANGDTPTHSAQTDSNGYSPNPSPHCVCGASRPCTSGRCKPNCWAARGRCTAASTTATSKQFTTTVSVLQSTTIGSTASQQSTSAGH